MSEELTFTRQPERISLEYTLQHDVPMLRMLRVEDTLGLRVSLGARGNPQPCALLHAANVLGRVVEGRGVE